MGLNFGKRTEKIQEGKYAYGKVTHEQYNKFLKMLSEWDKEMKLRNEKYCKQILWSDPSCSPNTD